MRLKPLRESKPFRIGKRPTKINRLFIVWLYLFSHPDQKVRTSRDMPALKEQCHEDFAVFGQFCAKIITLRLIHKQNASVKLQQRYEMNFIKEG